MFMGQPQFMNIISIPSLDDIPDVHPMPKHVRVNRDNGFYRVQSGTPRKGEAAKTKPRENENLNDDREKWKQAEEALHNMHNCSHNCWGRVREQLSLVGLSLIADPTVGTEHIGADSVEELSQQVYTARFVYEVVGRGIAKAEAETMVEA
ncbi:hypothetical protein SAY87_025397 [Trapa incisa]|uniref:Uncharacterized protein n=1 Tax=Trapa incisa TaxID=236973 RepID=A0AAN7GQP1_9MYRT|nr:hypothetical protein SAY87_025397 [Trapa incisa]